MYDFNIIILMHRTLSDSTASIYRHIGHSMISMFFFVSWSIRVASIFNKTAGYHRHIFCPSIFFKRCFLRRCKRFFSKKCFFFVKFSNFPKFKNFLIFLKKLSQLRWKRFLRKKWIDTHCTANLPSFLPILETFLNKSKFRTFLRYLTILDAFYGKCAIIWWWKIFNLRIVRISGHFQLANKSKKITRWVDDIFLAY